MAVLDLVWMVASYAALLAFIAIVGVLIFKFGITSFKLAISTVGATRGIENIRGVVNQPGRRTRDESDEMEIIVSYITRFVQKSVERNHYAKYIYETLRIELILYYIKSLDHFVESKLENVDYAGYMQALFNIEKITSRADSLKNFIESKREKNFAKYAYIQLFKK
ncbi:hypothetical protein [Methanobacterium veterum]|nr:hypothetical protein [Methanobacterium veterum]MCZ3365249.1 hypothetical protein [Methanobacterium veterum]